MFFLSVPCTNWAPSCSVQRKKSNPEFTQFSPSSTNPSQPPDWPLFLLSYRNHQKSIFNSIIFPCVYCRLVQTLHITSYRAGSRGVSGPASQRVWPCGDCGADSSRCGYTMSKWGEHVYSCEYVRTHIGIMFIQVCIFMVQRTGQGGAFSGLESGYKLPQLHVWAPDIPTDRT